MFFLKPSERVLSLLMVWVVQRKKNSKFIFATFVSCCRQHVKAAVPDHLYSIISKCQCAELSAPEGYGCVFDNTESVKSNFPACCCALLGRVSGLWLVAFWRLKLEILSFDVGPVTGQELLCNSVWCSGALLPWQIKMVSKQINPKQKSCGLNFSLQTCGIFPLHSERGQHDVGWRYLGDFCLFVSFVDRFLFFD